MMKTNCSRQILFCLLFFVSSQLVSAQVLNFNNHKNDRLNIGVSFDKPFYSNSSDISALTGVFQISANITLSSKFSLITNIPYINMDAESSYDWGSYSYEENGFGNIFVGLQSIPDMSLTSGSVISFGIFLPTAEKNAAFNGLFMDYYNLQKYYPEHLGLYFNYAHFKYSWQGFYYKMEVGPNLVIPTENNGTETELFLHYGITAGFKIESISIFTKLHGMGIVTEEVDNFDDRLMNMINFGFEWEEGEITAKAFYKIYMKESMRDIIDGVLGFGLSMAID